MSTRNNVDATGLESHIILPEGFNWADVYGIIMRAEQFPQELPRSQVGPRGLIPGAEYASCFKYLRTSIKSQRATAPENLQAFAESCYREVMDEHPYTGSTVSPFSPRNQVSVPQDPTASAIVLSFIVPLGYQMWISGYAFDLFPSTALELNYSWRVLVNGQDILNKNQNTVIFGRPVKNNSQVVIGQDKSTQILANPGDEIKVIVNAQNAIPATDQLSATIFGNLEPAP